MGSAGRSRLIICSILLALAFLAGYACNGSNDLILATTTSTQDSGLLDVLVPAFENEYGYHVKTIAVGSGQALRLGEEGEADVILAHSPQAEEAFMAAGNGSERLLVMHNDFVIVGPADDPAGISGLTSAEEAFSRIAKSQTLFLSRGDQSGTNTEELSIWKEEAITPSGAWYQETGSGMGATLNIASDKRGYTLSDRGTYLAQRQNLDLRILTQGDPKLLNVYHVIVVNPEKHDDVNVKGARDFARYITSAAAQEMIGRFGVDKVGEPLFFPDAVPSSSPATGR